MKGDPISFKESMRSADSSKCLQATQDEMRSMSTNDVWDLKEIPKGAKIVGCNESTKSKCDSNGNVERYKSATCGERHQAKFRVIWFNPKFLS